MRTDEAGGQPTPDLPYDEHVVQLYEHDDELIGTMGTYAARALAAAESFLFVATATHVRLIRDALRRNGINPERCEERGRLRFVDADEFLPKIMLGDDVERGAFLPIATQLIDELRSNGGGEHLHVFGELVSILWERGNPMATLRLEELWNELRAERPFTLYCAFRRDRRIATFLEGAMGDILGTHSSMVPPRLLVARRRPVRVRLPG